MPRHHRSSTPLRIPLLTEFPSYSKTPKALSNEITVSFKFPTVDMIRSSILYASSGMTLGKAKSAAEFGVPHQMGLQNI